MELVAEAVALADHAPQVEEAACVLVGMTDGDDLPFQAVEEDAAQVCVALEGMVDQEEDMAGMEE